MEQVQISGTVNAPADEVWEIAGDFGRLDSFVEAITDCTTEGSGIGSIRTLTLQDGGKVSEKLESLEPERRLLKYSIVDSPMPIRNYTGTIEVRAMDSNRSKFIWSSNFDVAEGHEQEIKEAMQSLYSLGVEDLQEKFS